MSCSSVRQMQNGGQQNASKPASNFQGQPSSPAARKYAVQQKRQKNLGEQNRLQARCRLHIAMRIGKIDNLPCRQAASGADCSLLCRLGQFHAYHHRKNWYVVLCRVFSYPGTLRLMCLYYQKQKVLPQHTTFFGAVTSIILTCRNET